MVSYELFVFLRLLTCSQGLGATSRGGRKSSLMEQEHSVFPLDIYTLIIEHLGGDLYSLKSFSLASRAISGLCRPHIFADVAIQGNTTRLIDIFVRSPETVKFVKKLTLLMALEALQFFYMIPQAFRNIAAAGTITTFRWSAFGDWEHLPDDFKNTLLLLLGQPSLRIIDLRNLFGIPRRVFSACNYVRSITLKNYSNVLALTNSCQTFDVECIRYMDVKSHTTKAKHMSRELVSAPLLTSTPEQTCKHPS
jgi:hypothetical protein